LLQIDPNFREIERKRERERKRENASMLQGSEARQNPAFE